MAMIDNQKDMVISYVVVAGSPDPDIPASLAEFLKAGYRVLDVISTPAGSSSYFCITVVLTMIGAGEESKFHFYAGGKGV